MAVYRYTAVDPAGRRQSGREDAAEAAALHKRLRARGLWVVDVSPVPERNTRASIELGGANRRSVLVASRSLASLLSAGLPLGRALRTTRGIVAGSVASALEAVETRVSRGDALHAALADHQAIFSALYVGLVRAGERSGDLAGTFRRLATHLEKQEALRQRLASASVYPLLLAAAGTVAIVTLLLFVLPRFVELLDGTGASLPWTTAALLALAGAARALWPLFLVPPAAGLAFLVWQQSSERGRRCAAVLALRAPLVAGLRRRALGARFARLSAILLDGGAPLLPALKDAAMSIGDPLARDEVERIGARVREGAPLHGALAGGSLFPGVLTQLVQVGEEAGELSAFLERAAEILEMETERTLQRLVILAEPAMILGFGLVVAFVALSLLQAIYSVNAGSF